MAALCIILFKILCLFFFFFFLFMIVLPFFSIQGSHHYPPQLCFFSCGSCGRISMPPPARPHPFMGAKRSKHGTRAFPASAPHPLLWLPARCRRRQHGELAASTVFLGSLSGRLPRTAPNWELPTSLPTDPTGPQALLLTSVEASAMSEPKAWPFSHKPWPLSQKRQRGHLERGSAKLAAYLLKRKRGPTTRHIKGKPSQYYIYYITIYTIYIYTTYIYYIYIYIYTTYIYYIYTIYIYTI